MKKFVPKITPKDIGNYILRGIFIVAPLFLTGLALYKMFHIIDSPIQEIFYSIFGFRIYGLGVLTTLFILFVAGYLGTSLLMNSVFNKFEILLL